jgi:hypothetical protein
MSGTSNVVYYLAGDDLGSTSLVLDSRGARWAKQHYYPYGEAVAVAGTLPTNYQFTRGKAFAGGEFWRTGENEITVNAGFGAFGYNYKQPDLIAQAIQRYDTAVSFFRELGLTVTAIPAGKR